MGKAMKEKEKEKYPQGHTHCVVNFISYMQQAALDHLHFSDCG